MLLELRLLLDLTIQKNHIYRVCHNPCPAFSTYHDDEKLIRDTLQLIKDFYNTSCILIGKYVFYIAVTCKKKFDHE